MKKNSELTYKEMYQQPASFQAVNDTLEDIFKTLDKVFFGEKKYDLHRMRNIPLSGTGFSGSVFYIYRNPVQRCSMLRTVLFPGNLCKRRQKCTDSSNHQKKLYHRSKNGY